MKTVAGLAQGYEAYELRDLALAAAIELEQAEEGGSFDREPIVELATALFSASRSGVSSGSHRFVTSSYYRPLRGLHSWATQKGKSLDGSSDLEAFVEKLAKRLRRVGQARPVDHLDAAELLDYCLALHSQLIGEMRAGERRGYRREKSSPRVGAA